MLLECLGKNITIGLEIGLLTKITFWSLLKVPFKMIFWWKPCEKIHWRRWYKMPSKLLGSIGFLYKVVYIKLAVSLCSFLQFSFPFNFRTVNTLVLKFGTLTLSCRFSNTLLAIFDILFRSRVIHRLYRKMGQKWHPGVFFNITLFQKRI